MFSASASPICKEDGVPVQPHTTASTSGQRNIIQWTPALRAAVSDCMALRWKVISIRLFCTRAGQPCTQEDGRAIGFDSIWQRFMAKVVAESTPTERFPSTTCAPSARRMRRASCTPRRTRRGASTGAAARSFAAQQENRSGVVQDNRGLVGQHPRRKRRNSLKNGAPGEIRTPDHLVRREVLGFRKYSLYQRVMDPGCPTNCREQSR